MFRNDVYCKTKVGEDPEEVCGIPVKMRNRLC